MDNSLCTWAFQLCSTGSSYQLRPIRSPSLLVQTLLEYLYAHFTATNIRSFMQLTVINHPMCNATQIGYLPALSSLQPPSQHNNAAPSLCVRPTRARENFV
ncbi:unnamed protein product [Ceratitis capitata]|uniref:(Mediterranean fruit fly) hypothetical protein n=1 Tax=Ceratitis capitata TaxID=7213 RepID=A0A811V9F4_CERCA|nr:unnamed protein product [Ceratitis capitata]